MASLSWMMTLSVRRKKAWEEVLQVRADMEANCSSHGGLTFVAPLIMTHSLVNLEHRNGKLTLSDHCARLHTHKSYSNCIILRLWIKRIKEKREKKEYDEKEN